MNALRSALFDLRILRGLIERRMESLPGWFNHLVPHGRLRLRPWRRTKEDSPYAVYWILLNRRIAERFSWIRKQPRFPFCRLKIRSRQDLDDAIFHGMVTSRRQDVYRYHDQATTLNAAHSSISRAVDDVRKYLQGFRLTAPPTKDSFKRVEAHLLAFDRALDDARTELQALDVEMRIYATSLPLRLVFEQDAHHPYGRVRWRWVRDGRSEQPLTDRRKRELRIPAELRPLFTPYESRRRQVMSRLLRLTKIAKRLKTRILPIPDQVRVQLEIKGIPVSVSLSQRNQPA